MPTRAAAKREAAFLQESLDAASLSNVPDKSARLKRNKAANRDFGVGNHSNGQSDSLRNGGDIGDNPDDPQIPTSLSLGEKRKRALPKIRRTVEPVTGGFDVLPHGLGKKCDLVEDTDQQDAAESLVSLSKKRTRRNNNVKAANNIPIFKLEGAVDNTFQLQPNGVDLSSPSLQGKENKQAKGEGDNGLKARRHRGHATNTHVLTPELSASHNAKDVAIKDTNVKNENFEEANAKTANNSHEKIVVDSDSVLDESRKLPKRRKKKSNSYGLTPGHSPFPDFIMPTPEACEEITRLLSELHGEVKAPEVIPPPSTEVTGCGEVPDLLDAILRTLLSASTTANNSNMALKGLKDKFGLRTSGIGEGSVNWEAVHHADLPTVIESIKRGGLAKVKGTNIKKILDMVHDQNCSRRDTLIESESRNVADITGDKERIQERQDNDVPMPNDSMLSMDHVFEMTTDEAMEEMTRLPGIGVKTASCVVLFCMRRPSFAVDTHVWRHCKWLGWVPENATRDQTFSHCEVRVPDHLKYPLHQLFLRHGKTCGRCRANTSAGTEEWENTVCPIDHLITRKEKKKTHGAGRSMKKVKAASCRQMVRTSKKITKDDDTEESNVEMEIHEYEDD